MKILRILFLLAKRADTRWALREINPMNSDVMKLRLRELHVEEELAKLMS